MTSKHGVGTVDMFIDIASYLASERSKGPGRKDQNRTVSLSLICSVIGALGATVAKQRFWRIHCNLRWFCWRYNRKIDKFITRILPNLHHLEILFISWIYQFPLDFITFFLSKWRQSITWTLLFYSPGLKRFAKKNLQNGAYHSVWIEQKRINFNFSWILFASCSVQKNEMRS